jgi:hypothetical protein
MPFVMAIIIFLWRILHRHQHLYGGNYFLYGENCLGWSRRYGGNYLQMGKSGREHYGDGCFFAEALNSLHLIARAMRRRSPSAKRANREAESGLRCNSVVK